MWPQERPPAVRRHAHADAKAAAAAAADARVSPVELHGPEDVPHAVAERDDPGAEGAGEFASRAGGGEEGGEVGCSPPGSGGRRRRRRARASRRDRRRARALEVLVDAPARKELRLCRSVRLSLQCGEVSLEGWQAAKVGAGGRSALARGAISDGVIVGAQLPLDGRDGCAVPLGGLRRSPRRHGRGAVPRRRRGPGSGENVEEHVVRPEDGALWGLAEERREGAEAEQSSGDARGRSYRNASPGLR